MRSLLMQGLREDEYEIILVDDGSNDGSEVLCDQYAETYQQVQVIHQSNQGVSAARNTGLRACKGEWVMFIDSDDRLVEGTLRTILEKCEQQDVEAMCMGYVRKREDKTLNTHIAKMDEKQIISGKEWLNKKMDFYCYVWRWMFKRKLIETNHIYFTPNINVYEELDWLPRMLLAAQRVGNIPEVVYEYEMREGSLTHPRTKEEVKAIIEKHLDAITLLQEKQKYGLTWVDSMSSCMVVAVLTLVGKYCYNERQIILKTIRQIYSRPLRCQRSFSWQERMKVIMARCSAGGYCWLRHILNKR